MAAGDFSSNSPCMGPTGLLLGETDYSASPGCAPGQNNFLAPINVLAGEQYVLAINYFSATLDTVRVEFCGTALLGCDSILCTTLSASQLPSPPGFRVGIFTPNPVVASEPAALNISSDHTQSIRINLFEANGKLIRSEFRALNFGDNPLTIETKGLETGIYFVSICGESAAFTRRLVVGK